VAENRIRIVELFSLLLLIVLSYAFYRVMAPFLLDLFLAIVAASLFFGFYRRVTRLIGGRQRLGAFLTTVILVLLVAIPVSVVAVLVYTQAVSTASRLAEQWPGWMERLATIDVEAFLGGLPVIGEYVGDLRPIQLQQSLREILQVSSNVVLQVSRQSVITLSEALFHGFITVVLLFFLFVDGPTLQRRMYEVLPVANRELQEITDEAQRTTAATLISTLAIGLVEGTFGSVLFALFGLPAPLLWGVIILIISMIPMVGTNLVLVPAAFVVMLQGRILAGLAMMLIGFGGVTVSQNVLKPALLGGRSGLHPAIVLLATIGGLAWLGLIGVLVGPILASLFIVVWRQFGMRYEQELEGKREREESAAHSEETEGVLDEAD
jgi:predicted PurR-regulated permease PerM